MSERRGWKNIENWSIITGYVRGNKSYWRTRTQLEEYQC
jgi:hypothetical protein